MFSTGFIPDMIAGTTWKIDVAVSTDVWNSNAVLCYLVLDSNNTGADTNNALGFFNSVYQNVFVINPSSPFGSWMTFTDSFEIKPSAVGSCDLQITGGTYDNSLWSGNYKLTLTLTRLS
jgi:hypothetical protein